MSLKNPMFHIVPTTTRTKEIAKVNEEVPISPIEVDLYVIILRDANKKTTNAIIKKHSEINKISIIITTVND